MQFGAGGRFVGFCGAFVLVIFGLTALFADSLAPHALNVSFTPYLPPSAHHLLGTNDMGYDIFSELLHAARLSLAVGVLAALMSIVVGVAVGLLSGYYKGFWGETLSGLIDVFLLIPVLPLMVILAAYLGASFWNVILVIGLLSWCSTARVVRARVLQLREMPYIEALVALGIPDRVIILKHVLPNTAEVIVAKFVLAVAAAMLSEASLSFLGLGDPSRVSWGGMVHFAFTRGGFVNGMWYWYLPPGLCIAACTVAFTLLGMCFERCQERERMNARHMVHGVVPQG
ncbi:MAG: ABC transporter permease [Bacillota bacterium]